ncbi:hypothetical protein HOY82DRAFT_595732 [Tuber indicum]|nr:hypothetical protein HOY82DRAFT_595732 [Tuber indicum]
MMMRPTTTSSPLSSPDPQACVSEPEFESESTRTNSTALESPSEGVSPTITTDRTSPDSPDNYIGEKDMHAKDADAMEISEDGKTTTSIAASVGKTESTIPARKRTRERKFWYRNLSPVRTRSSTGSLPGSSKKSQVQTTPQKVGYVTPVKPRKPRATPTTTSTIKKSNPRHKRKSPSAGKARKRSRKSSALEDKQVDDDVIMGDDGEAPEVNGKDGESAYEDKAKTPGPSDDGHSSPGGFYDEQDTETYAKPDESAPRDRVKTPGNSGDEASSSGGWHDSQNTDSCAKRDESVPRDGVKTPGISDDEASSPGGYYYDAPRTGFYSNPNESAPGSGVKTPGISGDEASSPGGYYYDAPRTGFYSNPNESAPGSGVKSPGVSDSETEYPGCGQSERLAGNGSGTPVKVDPQSLIGTSDEGSTDFQARENGAEGLKESEAAFSNGELKHEKINLTEHQVENIPSVQNHHDDGIEPKSKPEVSPLKKHQDPDEETDLETQEEVGRGDCSRETGEGGEVCV